MRWTSGLGKVYPVKFLSLHSLVDGVDEYVDGVTPYHNTFALGNFFAVFNRMYTIFPDIWMEANAKPAWRRWENVESMTVNASEYTVWETISPCAAATGYLMNPQHNSPPLMLRPAARRMSDQPGYWALP